MPALRQDKVSVCCADSGRLPRRVTAATIVRASEGAVSAEWSGSDKTDQEPPARGRTAIGPGREFGTECAVPA